MGQVIDAPHWLDCELEQAFQREVKGNCKTRSDITLPIAAGDAVHCQHHDIHTHALCFLHHGLVQAAVLVKKELIDLWAFMLAHLLKAGCAEC